MHGQLLSDRATDLLEALKYWLLAAPSDATPPIDRVTACLSHSDAMVRQYAAEVLLRYADRAAPAVAALAKAVRSDSEARVRGTAAAALSAIGNPANDALRELLLDANPRVRVTVATALRGSQTISEELRSLVEFASPPIGKHAASAIPDGSFESGDDELSGWQVELHDGAAGHWELDATRSRSGRRSLKLVKTNGVGYIDLRSSEPIVIPPGKEVVTCRLWFHSEDAPISSALLLRVEGEDGELEMGDAARSGFEQQSQTHLRNQPPHVWNKRVLELKPSDQARRLYLHVILYGNPTTVWLDDIAFPATPWKGVSIDPIPPQPRYSTQAVLEKLAGEKPAHFAVENDGKRGVMLRDGEPAGTVLHYAFRPGNADFGGFDDAGVALQVVRIPIDDHAGVLGEDRFGEPAMGPMWPSAESSEYDFREAVRRIELALRQMPTSRLILALHVNWPRDYVQHNPDTKWLDQRGRGAAGNVMFLRGFEEELDEGMIWWPSPYQSKPLEDAAEVIRGLVTHLRSTPYWPRIAGYFVMGGHDGQFHIR
ncbi:MAG TPA: HEAT repeat domain-containing protein, partial [Phycisphaeraceae bacterium]